MLWKLCPKNGLKSADDLCGIKEVPDEVRVSENGNVEI